MQTISSPSLAPLSLSRTLVPKCPADFSVKEFKQQFESSVRIAVERKIKQGSVRKDGRRLFMEDLTFLTAWHCIIVDGVCITSNLKLRTNQFLGADRLPYFPLLTELPLWAVLKLCVKLLIHYASLQVVLQLVF